MAFDRALSNGVTTIQILPGSTPIFAGHSVVVKPVRAPTVWGMKATGAVQGFKMACGENPKSWGADDDNEGPTTRQGVVTYLRHKFLNAPRSTRAVEQARAGTGAPPPPDLNLQALARILSRDIRTHAPCSRAGQTHRVPTIPRT